MSVRLVLAVLVFVADVWALSRMFRQPFSRGRRIAWIARIVLLPGAGAFLWWMRERRRTVSSGAARDLPSAPTR